MARLKKEKVDYFPHMVSGGKTIFILEQRYGNDGYAFWFKLLELLGDTKGHYFCTSNYSDWHFLLAKVNIPEQLATEILDTLAELEAIDKELWQEKIVWVQKFVDNISDVYVKRRQEIPLKPSICSRNDTSPVIPVPEMRQTKLKETKVNKIKENKTIVDETVTVVVDENKNIFNDYARAGFGIASSTQAEKLMDIESTYGYEWTSDAIKTAALSNILTINYVEGILKRWKAKGRNAQKPEYKNGKEIKKDFTERDYNYKEEEEKLLGWNNVLEKKTDGEDIMTKLKNMRAGE